MANILTTTVAFNSNALRHIAGSDYEASGDQFGVRHLEGHCNAGYVTRYVRAKAALIGIIDVERVTICNDFAWRFFAVTDDGKRVEICEATHKGRVRVNGDL